MAYNASWNTFVKSSYELEYTNSGNSDIVPGALVKVGSKVGVAIRGVKAGATDIVTLTGIYTIAVASVTANQGDALYLTSDGAITATAGDNTYVGIAAKAIASGATTAQIALNI